jgi:putative transposase
MQYRRAKHKGGSYFFTVNLAERKNTLLTDHIDYLRIAIKQVQQKYPVAVEGCHFARSPSDHLDITHRQ